MFRHNLHPVEQGMANQGKLTQVGQKLILGNNNYI